MVPLLSKPLPGEHEDVRALALEGRRIDAIKLLREKTGWGLKESKDWVDAAVPPTSGSSTNMSGSGCLLVLAILAFAAWAVWHYAR